MYRCMRHAKTAPRYIVPTNRTVPGYYNKLKKPALIEYLTELNASNDCIQPIPTSTTDIRKEIRSILAERLFIPVKKVRSTDIDMVQLGRNLEVRFDAIMEGMGFDITTNRRIDVIIENQIGPLAMRMKTIQGMLTQYFIMRRVGDIHYISSANKLKVTVGIDGTIGVDAKSSKEPTAPTTYKDRKAEGIGRARNYLHAIEEKGTSEWFEKHPKKDDLADSLLQGLWYCHR